MEKTLNEVEVGEVGTIVRVAGTGIIRRRLFDMGITPGAQFSFRKKAPLGDPIEVTIRGYELTLRKDEANKILMEVVE